MDSLFERNVSYLAQTQPRLANVLRNCDFPVGIRVEYSKTGKPVPAYANTSYHSLEDPESEAVYAVNVEMSTASQERVLLVGFGFGYHAQALCRLGYSPIIYEPDIGLLKLAFNMIDLSGILPYATFHAAASIPSIPPKTKVMFHHLVGKLHPFEIFRLQQRIAENPPQTNDVTEGEKCETYRNVSCLKNPTFLASYQMLISLIRPNLIIEIGTCKGGSALYFSDMLNQMGGHRHVITIDISNDVAPEIYDQPNLTFFPDGHASFDLSIAQPYERVLVIEDSSHTYENTMEVLNRFASVVTPNSYFIVEDTAIEHPIYNGGPMRAVQEFLSRDSRFERDMRWERFFGPELEGHCIFLRRKPS